MKLFGLTGNIGCGKSTVASLLSEYLDVVVFDCDRIAKKIIPHGSNKQNIVSILGGEVFSLRGINLKAIARIIFCNPQKKRLLEDFVHPLVWTAIQEKIADLEGEKIYIVESALLYEVGWENRFTGIIVVACDLAEQMRRLKKVRRMEDVDIRTRLMQQLPLEEKVKRAQFVIDTHCTIEQLTKRVSDLYQKLREQKEMTW